MADSCDCTCCKHHTNCCCCWTNREIVWTLSGWLTTAGKKHAGDKSWKFFKERYIFVIYTEKTDDKCVFRARCYRSLKKNEEAHYLHLLVDEKDGKASIYRAHCSCTGGSGGHCNHLFAFIFQLNDYSSSKINEIPSDVTCTSQPQTWHIPRATSICPMPVMSTHYARSATGKKPRKRKPVTAKLYDARGKHANNGFSRQEIMDEVSRLKSKSKPPPFSYVLADQEPSVLVNTVFGNVAVGSILSYQLQDIGKPSTTFYSNTTLHSLDQPPEPTSFPDIPLVDTSNETENLNVNAGEFLEFYTQHIVINREDAVALEKRTVLQGECTEWLDVHQKRLTASGFGKVISRVHTPSESMIKNLFNPKDLSNVRPIAHGKSKEKVAREIYSNKMQKKISQFTVYDAGLSVNPFWTYLGASPDGKVYDPSDSISPFGFLEIKCPFTKRNSKVTEAAADKSFFLEQRNDNFCLKVNHN